MKKTTKLTDPKPFLLISLALYYFLNKMSRMRNKTSPSALENVDNCHVIRLLAELHGDLFSRNASPLEVYYVFVAVDERGEHVMSEEICCRCNGA